MTVFSEVSYPFFYPLRFVGYWLCAVLQLATLYYVHRYSNTNHLMRRDYRKCVFVFTSIAGLCDGVYGTIKMFCGSCPWDIHSLLTNLLTNIEVHLLISAFLSLIFLSVFLVDQQCLHESNKKTNQADRSYTKIFYIILSAIWARAILFYTFQIFSYYNYPIYANRFFIANQVFIVLQIICAGVTYLVYGFRLRRLLQSMGGVSYDDSSSSSAVNRIMRNMCMFGCTILFIVVWQLATMKFTLQDPSVFGEINSYFDFVFRVCFYLLFVFTAARGSRDHAYVSLPPRTIRLTA
eukprot:TRINITY_DN4663_c1_g2_i1.p1 TRINITY_DN4663_c1_g2~~TRINITY_DN4663_c1_g2_i1.p1  ORF type:complete len:323 (-),score=49.24 TRINITY_DN4663_c1_g2_i1:11-889(-)